MSIPACSTSNGPYHPSPSNSYGSVSSTSTSSLSVPLSDIVTSITTIEVRVQALIQKGGFGGTLFDFTTRQIREITGAYSLNKREAIQDLLIQQLLYPTYCHLRDIYVPQRVNRDKTFDKMIATRNKIIRSVNQLDRHTLPKHSLFYFSPQELGEWLRSLNRDQLENVFVEAASKGDSEIVFRIIQNRFAEIRVNKLNKAFEEGTFHCHEVVVQVILDSNRQKEVTDDLLAQTLKVAAVDSNGGRIGEVIIESERYKKMGTSHLGSALMMAAYNKAERIIQRMISSVRFKEIEVSNVEDALRVSAGLGHEGFVRAIIVDSGRLAEIGIEKLQEAYDEAIRSGYTQIAALFLDSSRGKQIRQWSGIG